MNASLSLLISTVKIAIQDMIVKDRSETYTDPIRNVKKLVSSQVSERTKCTENSSPFAHSKRISAQNLTMRCCVDIKGHKSVDVVVDVRKIHEGGSMKNSDHSANNIFL